MDLWPLVVQNTKYHVIDMETHTCTCRKQDLTVIPCVHAVAMMALNEETIDCYVNQCYHNDTQMKTYSNFIQPIRGAKQWVHVEDMKPTLPLMLRIPLSRPHKVGRNQMRPL